MVFDYVIKCIYKNMFDFRNFYQRYRLLARRWSQGQSCTNQQLAAQLGASIDIFHKICNNLYQRVKEAYWRGRLCSFYLGSTPTAINVPHIPPATHLPTADTLHTEKNTDILSRFARTIAFYLPLWGHNFFLQ
jgi:hypothetical protein